MRSFSAISLVLLCVLYGVGCVPTGGGSGGGGLTNPQWDSEAPRPPPTYSCEVGTDNLAQCERAVTAGRHCCWDAFGFSRSFDQWDPAAVTGDSLCRALAAQHKDPAQHCADFVGLFNFASDDDDGGTCPPFESELATSGAVLGVPLCCCQRGESCRAQDAGGALACGAR